MATAIEKSALHDQTESNADERSEWDEFYANLKVAEHVYQHVLVEKALRDSDPDRETMWKLRWFKGVTVEQLLTDAAGYLDKEIDALRSRVRKLNRRKSQIKRQLAVLH